MQGMAYRLRTRLAKCTDESVSWCVVERNISDWQGGEIRRRDRYFDFAFADAETRFLGRRDVKVGRLVRCTAAVFTFQAKQKSHLLPPQG